MDDAIKILLEQSPSLAGLVVLAISIWIVFKRSLEENRTTLNGYKELFEQHRTNIDDLQSKYKSMLEEQRVEIEKHRVNFRALLEDKERSDVRYDTLKRDFNDLLIENKNLLRLIERIESMVNATGSDVKFLQKELERHREDLGSVKDSMLRLEHMPQDKNA
ncbi:hypothetical protein [Vibrio salinus]|uniref:hypothetical protein n=1 Tax=Vibrio salinus TaxID=2899784 RepID=UPI001E3DAA2C|nr:hypothetical protein [Vibrio salinus]MCE0495756.1 hypothetical protein [Vibrio salinus]